MGRDEGSESGGRELELGSRVQNEGLWLEVGVWAQGWG